MTSLPFRRPALRAIERRARVLDRVGEALAGDEVGGGLDVPAEALVAAPSRRRAPGRGVRARGRRVPGRVELGRRKPARQLAQLVDRHGDLGDRAVERRARALRRGGELVLRVAQRETDRHEPLLGAVVEVALDAPTLLVGGRHDPRPRRLDLGQLATQLDPQPGDLDREAAGLDEPLEQGRSATAAAS